MRNNPLIFRGSYESKLELARGTYHDVFYTSVVLSVKTQTLRQYSPKSRGEFNSNGLLPPQPALKNATCPACEVLPERFPSELNLEHISVSAVSER